MYCWLLLQIYLCDLWLVLWSRVTFVLHCRSKSVELSSPATYWMNEWMNEWMMHLYSAFIVYCHTPKALYNHVGGLSSTTTSVQHPLGWCDGSHSTTAPVRSPHTSYRWRGERVIEPIKWMGIIRRPWLTRSSGGKLATILFFMQSRIELHERFVWAGLSFTRLLLVWSCFYICQTYIFLILKTNKQAQPRWEK